MKRFLIAVTIATSLSAFGQQATHPPRESGYEETISVTGTGRATLAPDRFSFTAGVRTTAPTVEDAVSQNNTRVAAVIAALKRAGATDQEVRTSNFSIYPQQVYEQNQPPRVTGYQVFNSVTVTKKDPAAAGRLLQAAITAGVNEASSLSFEVSDLSRGRDQGLKAAFDDARAKAALLAQAAGRTLGRALVITEGGQVPLPRPVPQVRQMTMRAEGAIAGDVAVEGGTSELSYTVSVIFALQ
jgi:uncharacterized protein YggE